MCTKKYLKNILLRFIKLILIFVSGAKTYYLELIFFSWISFSRKSWWKKHVDRDLFFEEKRQKALEKILSCKFIRTNTSKEGSDADYEASRIQTFISKFKDRQLKILNKELKELEDKREKLTGQNV